MGIGTVMTCKAWARRGIDRICNGCAPSGVLGNGAEMQSAVGTGNGIVSHGDAVA